MKKILFVFWVVFFLNTNAQTYITIPDAAFVTYLQGIIPSAMNGNQMDISSSLVSVSTQTIDVNGLAIYNLHGIQYFTSLIYLDCSNCHLTTLPTLPNSITYLNCNNNLAGGTHFSGFANLPTSLIYLNCAQNHIFCYPTFPNSITTLYIDAAGNPCNCFPNYIAVMNSAELAVPICATGNSNGCVVATTNISQYSNLTSQISIYPNPSNGVFNLSINQLDNAKMYNLNVYNITGECVHKQIATSSNCQIDLSNLPAGIYNINLIDNEAVVNKRAVITR